MRKRSLFVVAFLMFLYIGPVILVSSYSHTAILTEPNAHKDFQVASWYGESWPYRQNITIIGASGAGINYQINITVPYNAHMQTDFDDIIFTDNDEITLLDYWRETYIASTSAVFWVNVIDDLGGSDQTIYMYYGNSAVSSASNGTDTFIFFDDFENNNFDRWDTAEANWAITGAEKKYGSYSAFGDADATGRDLDKAFVAGLTDDFMVHTWIRNEIDTGTTFPMFALDEEADDVYLLGTGIDDFRTFNGSDWNLYDEASAISDTWIRTELAVDNTNSLFRLWIDRVAASNTWPNIDGSGNTISALEQVGATTSTVDLSDQWLDDFYIRKWVLVEPAFNSFGAEEIDPTIYPQWEQAGEATLLFNVPFDMWGYNTGLIILGLCMIPVSMLYLAYGIKHDRSSNRLFYGLILLFMGFGLFIGGILP